jgi:hypothetical protein
VLRSGRSSRHGLYLVFASFVTLIFGAFAAMAGAGSLVYLLILMIGAVELAAGWALLKRGQR